MLYNEEYKIKLTKETIKGELLDQISTAIKIYSCLSVICTAVFVIPVFVLSNTLRNNTFGNEIFITALLICSVPTLIFLYLLFKHISLRKKVINEDFIIETDIVEHKEKSWVWHTSHIHTYLVLQFKKYGDVRVDKESYNLTSEGDSYYIVSDSYESLKAIKYYHTKIYYYEE